MEHVLVQVRGIVQGVGFRPFMHQYTKELQLNGVVRNTSSGIELELEGEKEQLERFLKELPSRAPKLAVIEAVETEWSEKLQHYEGFQILSSRTDRKRNTLISPDIAICEDCRRELLDAKDRRYRYPFINCTNCGPRFTIIRDVPYDRKNTSMEEFPMCPACGREYQDIENRRYHAQPNCCPICGPQMMYYNAEGQQMTGNPVELTRENLKAGKILAIKGLGGIHLACKCTEEDIVNELRRRKQRDEKPFAVMCRDVEAAKMICEISEEEEQILNGFRKPIVLLRKKHTGWSAISENGFIGVMLPYTPLHCLLFDDSMDMLIMTSANLSDTPILYQNAEALEKLKGIADGFLLNNREIRTRCDDSLCWVLEGTEYFARKSRGYAPFPVKVPMSRGMILACGAEQKASFCLSKGQYVFQSPHIGDLKNYETYEYYIKQIAHFEHMFDLKPQMVCCDLHPDYMSSEYAEKKAETEQIPLLRIQHHHAHMAACMADNNLEGTVIGLIWDGTGYGTDGTIWGGECLAGGYEGFERFGSIRPIPLPGGDKATTEIQRIAFALLRESGCTTENIPDEARYRMMMELGLNCPQSSGMGRLFDGVAAIAGIKECCSYEGQGAVLLEAEAASDDGVYTIGWERTQPLRFDWRPMIREIVRDRDQGTPKGVLAARFMNTLVIMAAEMCAEAAECYGTARVVMSGGTFQNMYLMERIPKELRKRGLIPYHHRSVSTNDEGLSLGQLLIAQNRGERNVFGNTAQAD